MTTKSKAIETKKNIAYFMFDLDFSEGVTSIPDFDVGYTKAECAVFQYYIEIELPPDITPKAKLLGKLTVK